MADKTRRPWAQVLNPTESNAMSVCKCSRPQATAFPSIPRQSEVTDDYNSEDGQRDFRGYAVVNDLYYEHQARPKPRPKKHNDDVLT